MNVTGRQLSRKREKRQKGEHFELCLVGLYMCGEGYAAIEGLGVRRDEEVGAWPALWI